MTPDYAIRAGTRVKVFFSGPAFLCIIPPHGSPFLAAGHRAGEDAGVTQETTAEARILVVDDDPQVRSMLAQFLARQRYVPLTASCAGEAVEVLGRDRPDLVLLDVRLPDADGIELLRERIQPALGRDRVIVMTGYGTREDAHRAVLHGAYDYVMKPIALPKLGIVIRNCLRLQELAREVAELSREPPGAVSLQDLVGASPQMTALVERIKQVAAFDVPVLIQGENGTGKELVARAIHALGSRRKGPFVAVDCGALPETLVEGELFGYERGAFSGAVRAKPGKIEQAGGGTLLLDEIGNIPLSIQPKLLRALQSMKVERLGGREPVSVDVRLLSATNADVERMIEEGTFRRDLYHRLNTVVLTIPPLRERVGDIPLLARYALLTASRAYKKSVVGISPEAMALLERYPWPGNVRELENCLRSAVIMATASWSRRTCRRRSARSRGRRPGPRPPSG
jgi:DNA-binding NtrC family response regulator